MSLVLSLQRLSLQLAKAEEKLTEFREKLRDTRTELTTKNRQLEVARGLVTRLGDEKKLAEVRERDSCSYQRSGACLRCAPLTGVHACARPLACGLIQAVA